MPHVYSCASILTHTAYPPHCLFWPLAPAAHKGSYAHGHPFYTARGETERVAMRFLFFFNCIGYTTRCMHSGLEKCLCTVLQD